MGCDIHLSVEYRHKDEKKRWRDEAWDCAMGVQTVSRNYSLFALLAQVRGEDRRGYMPRGLPPWDVLSITTKWGELFHIVDNPDSDSCCVDWDTVGRWGKWVKILTKDFKPWNDTMPRDEAKYVRCPDWHSHSWLTTAEFRRALKLHFLQHGRDIEYGAILAMMSYYEKNGYEARIVFWFDN
jgi:hypothetical protein